jgi:spore maturation protein B
MSLGSFAPVTVISAVLIFAAIKKIKIFDSFVKGAQGGFECAVSTMMPLVALITSVAMLKASGAFDMLTCLISPVISFLGFPAQCVPLAVMKPISGSASTALLTSILKDYGADSETGRLAAAIAGSTETLFYTMAIYFGTIGVSDTRHAVFCALTADIAAVICAASIIKGNLFGF